MSDLITICTISVFPLLASLAFPALLAIYKIPGTQQAAPQDGSPAPEAGCKYLRHPLAV